MSPSAVRLSKGFQLALVEARALDVTACDFEKARALVGLELAHHLSRRAHHQHTVRNFLALGNERIGAHQHAFADLRAVQHHAVDADERAFADGATVQHHLVADAHVALEQHRKSRIDVQHRGVLHVAVFADGDAVVLRADDALEPDVGIRLQDNVADDGGIVRDVVMLADQLDAALTEGKKRHADIIVACARANPSFSKSAVCATTCAAGARTALLRSCCCMGGWMCRPRSNSWWMRSRATGTSMRPTGAATG